MYGLKANIVATLRSIYKVFPGVCPKIATKQCHCLDDQVPW